ncbi:MAG: carboxypeptidase regulatory-like domain-containing protein, partial [Acidimicrobiia bacterium]|nr:carboxypeptidase regulatory-like domain-containing protein [Acidimicrobiia bacterium]
MKRVRTGWLLAAAALLLVPSLGYAQEAVITGRVDDATGGVLPGVTVTAVHEATGNVFLGVTDELGVYRIPVRIGGFRISAELQGFATVTRSGVTVLVGQTITIDLQMAPASLQESVTVTAEAPLIDMRQSTVGANLDSRQLSEIPLSGRNWTELVMLMPGSRANEVGTNGTGGPVARTGRSGGTQGTYQVNIDGQQVTQTVAGTFTNPNFSRESIAEFQFISNRFDAAQGRSTGIQVNAVTKSGTNNFEGTFSGYFRNSKWGERDFIRNTILPYSNQQMVGTFGGPIRTDRLHFFGHYEIEREPRVVAFTTPWPTFNQDLRGDRMEHKSGVRLDWDMGGQRRLAISSNFWSQLLPNRFDLNSSTDHPSATTRELARMQRVNAQLTQVLGSRAVNVINVGVYRQTSNETSYIGDDRVGKIQFNSSLSVGPGLTDVGRTPFRWNP